MHFIVPIFSNLTVPESHSGDLSTHIGQETWKEFFEMSLSPYVKSELH